MSYDGNPVAQVDHWIAETWDSRLVSLAKKKAFWMDQIGGMGSGSPVIDYGDVLGGKNDVVHLPTTSFFTGNPITDDSTLVVGNAQKFSPDELQITLKMRRFATSWSDVAESRSIVNLASTGMDHLAYQLADNIDEDLFIVATTSHTYNVYGGSSLSADSSLASTDVFNVAAVRKIVANLGFNRALPLGNTSGGALYGIAAHDYNIYDLKSDSTYQNHVSYGEIRGSSNPLFTGQLPIVDGLMILKSKNVPYGATNTTASTTYDEDGVGSGIAGVTHMFAFGAEALAMAYASGWRPHIVDAMEDAKTKRYMHATAIYGVRRLVEKSSLVGHYYATAV